LFGLSILIVDDNPVVLQATRAGALHLGLAVECAESGERALKALRAHPVDAVLMDLQMPGGSGIDTTLAIRSLDVAWADVPVIAVSATTSDGDRARCRAAGMNAYLEKPVSPRRLAVTLTALFPSKGFGVRGTQAWVDTDLPGPIGAPDAVEMLVSRIPCPTAERAAEDPVVRAGLQAALAEQIARGGAAHPLTQALLRAAARPLADPPRPLTLSVR
jgi:CheY-like chemotaxis protein